LVLGVATMGGQTDAVLFFKEQQGSHLDQDVGTPPTHHFANIEELSRPNRPAGFASSQLARAIFRGCCPTTT
jgi:hypothetical protein